MDSEWNMDGCGWDDPERLRSPEDLLELIQKLGFLPLFSNEIPGFSVEEHTHSSSWWTDDPASDPWAWRQLLASNAFIAYGKFFDKKAGFIYKDWIPDFTNYRRDGYDYQGMYEDGKMNSRSKRVLDVLELNDDAVGLEMLSCDIRKKAALEKGFEGTITDLQMHGFLIMSGFRQKRNRRGEEYGWHVAALMTPETKWGYDWVNSVNDTPVASWEKISTQIRKHFPEADDKKVRKVLGIRK